ncbi:MAG: ABC transporter permease [Myxococcales bacterium]|nr:ABC transporter permease [Myxococcales bacterium]
MALEPKPDGETRASAELPLAPSLAGGRVTWPLSLAGAGAVIAIAMWLADADIFRRYPYVKVMGLLTGGALFAAGLTSFLFMRATRRAFEWLVAWRYLKNRKRSWVALVVGVSALLIGGGLLVAAKLTAHDPLALSSTKPSALSLGLSRAALGAFVFGSWATFFGLLMLSFSAFTSISILGVFLGTQVLVVVLSVMGGFEHDLRRKILGTRAHVVVTTERRPFGDYRKIVRAIQSVPDVVAVSPYIEGEVMITSQSNLSGVLLRGIDVKRIAKVTDLPRYMKAEGGAGSINNLLHPDKLAKLPSVPLFRSKQSGSGTGSGTSSGPGSGTSTGTGTGTAAASQPASRPASQPASKPAVPDGSDYRGTGPKIKARPVYPGVIVGAELARNLRLYVGDDVNVISPLGGMSPMGPIPKSRPFRVAGIFYSGMYEYDTKFAYVTIPTAQRFLGRDDVITGVEIKGADVSEATALADRIRKKLDAICSTRVKLASGKTITNSCYVVKDWQQLNRNLFSALKLEKVVMFFVLTFIVVVAALAIVITLTMIVLEKTREIAALKALGASQWSLLKVFIFAGVYVGVIGMLVGVLQGVVVCSGLAYVGLPLDPEVYYIDRLPVRINAIEIALVGLSAVMLSFLATIPPAITAARLKPVEGLKVD